jgi:transposase
MKAYSSDLRTKIMDAVDAGMTKSEAARTFRVGLATIKRYAALRREQGTLVPKPHPGRSPTIGPEQQELLWAQLTEHPAAYLDEHCALFAQQTGIVVSTSTMSRVIRKLGWTRKKGRWVPPNETRSNVEAGSV